MAEFSNLALASGVGFAGDQAVAVVVVGKQRPKQKQIIKERIVQCQQEMEQDLMEPDQWDVVSAHVAEMNSSLEIINSLAWVGQTAGASAGSVTGIRDGVGEQIPYLMQRIAKSKICRTGRTGSKINWMRSHAKLRTGTNPLCSSFQGEIAIPFTL